MNRMFGGKLDVFQYFHIVESHVDSRSKFKPRSMFSHLHKNKDISCELCKEIKSSSVYSLALV